MVDAIESKWLRSALRYSLSATSYTSSLAGHGPPELQDPRIRKLFEKIDYSRRLILTYHIVLLTFICFAAGLHWLERARTWRRRRRLQLHQLREDVTYDGDANINNLEIGSTFTADLEERSSSGSSTLEGTEDVVWLTKDVHEETPLLHSGHTQRPLSIWISLIRPVQAFLTYQPRPIPILNKVLPSNAFSIIIICFIALNIFYTLFQIKFTIFDIFVFADRCGLVFVANLPLLYLLAAKTNPLKFLTGYSYESLNIIHRRLGELLCLEALLHSIGMFLAWYILLRPVGFTLSRFLLSKIVLTGVAALISYELLYFTSLASFRQRWYELFLGLHVFLQTAALILLFFHHSNSRVYVGIALGIFLIDRLLYRFGIKSATYSATADVMEDGETVRLSTILKLEPSSALRWLFGGNIGQGWQSSDHVFISAPSLGRTHIVQAHPFSIMSPAPQANDKQARLDLLIRAQRGFSSNLLRKATETSSLTIRIDGPYGSHHARAILQSSDTALIIAGGSGCAVAWPLVHYLLALNAPQKIILVWIVHCSAHISWIGWPALQEVGSRGVQVIVPKATQEVGRPDLRRLMRKLIMEDGVGKRIGVVGSGPDSMGRTVRNTCAEMLRDGWNVGVLIEKFGW